MRPSIASVAGRGNPSGSLDHADGDARPERPVADEVGHREHTDSAADQERRPGRERLRGPDVGCPAHLNSRASTAGRARSSIARVLAALASTVARRASFQPTPPSASSRHIRSPRRCRPALSRIVPYGALTSSDEGIDDRRLLRVAGTWERVGPIWRPRIGTTAGDVHCTLHGGDARSARSSLPVGSSRTPTQAAPTGWRRRFEASLLLDASSRRDSTRSRVHHGGVSHANVAPRSPWLSKRTIREPPVPCPRSRHAGDREDVDGSVDGP